MKLHLNKIVLMVAIMMTFAVGKLMAYTAVVSGDWSSTATWGGIAPGGSVTGQDIIIPSGITVNMDMDVAFAGLLNSFTVNGTLSTAAGYGVTMDQGAFTGNGTVNIYSLTFTSLFATMTFTGNAMVHSFRNQGATLGLAAIMNISDTLDLSSGSISVNSGSNITPQTNSTIKVDDGTLGINGGVFNTGTTYNVMYTGGSKTAGMELNTVTLGNLYLHMSSDAQTLTTVGDLEVNGNLYATRGTLNFNGSELTLRGDMISSNTAMLEGNAASSLTIEGATTLTSGLRFSSGTTLGDLNINKSSTGNVKLLSELSIASNLRLMQGDFSLESGNSLTLGAGSMVHIEDGALVANGGTLMATAAYNVEYMGSSNTSGLELTGSGLNDLRVALSSPLAMITMNSDAVVTGEFDFYNGKLNLGGKDLTLNGTMDQATTAWLMGNSNSDLTLRLTSLTSDSIRFDNTNQTLSMLVLDLPASNMVTLASGMTIIDELKITRGKLDLGMHDLVLQSTGVITGYTDSDYIVTSATGRLQMTVNLAAPYVTFPIGTADNYSPAMIQQTASGTSGAFWASTRVGFLSQGTSGFNYATSGSLVDRTWMIEADPSVTVNMNMKLGWTSMAQVNGFDAQHAYISHYTNAAWDTYTEGSASVGLNNTFEITRTGVTSLSPFGVVDRNVVLTGVTPEVATSFQLYPNPVQSVLHVAFADPSLSYDYAVVDLTGKTLMTGFKGRGGFDVDVTMLESGYYLLKTTRVGSNALSVQKFIKE